MYFDVAFYLAFGFKWIAEHCKIKPQAIAPWIVHLVLQKINIDVITSSIILQ